MMHLLKKGIVTFKRCKEYVKRIYESHVTTYRPGKSSLRRTATKKINLVLRQSTNYNGYGDQVTSRVSDGAIATPISSSKYT